ncbi:MAG: nascent polypeptide-associated complex protein [Candidatus Methanomethylophilaceae archaeon]|jgi:nascent polypeptide-associated complex subunit alpha
MAGMRGVNQRQMQQAMKKMGIKQTNINNVQEVIIRTDKDEIVITNADVVCVDMQGNKSYQISGTEEVRPLGSVSEPAGRSFPNEDIELVMSQANCDREKAVAALEACDGQPAEAIIKIMTE